LFLFGRFTVGHAHAVAAETRLMMTFLLQKAVDVHLLRLQSTGGSILAETPPRRIADIMPD
jgi:hypothetical protein